MKKTILIVAAMVLTTLVAKRFSKTFYTSSTKAHNHLCEHSLHENKQNSIDNKDNFITDCHELNNHELLMKIESCVTGSIDGNHSVNLTVVVNDTVEFSAIEISSGNYFAMSSFPLDTGTVYLPDSNGYQIHLSYNEMELPDYYQEIKITLFTKNNRYDEFIYLYFENDSLYTWSAYDFLGLNREWIIPHYSESIAFSLGEIDTMTIPALDTLLPFQYIQVPGKSYSVPVNIDTTGLEEDEHYRRLIKTFKGRVTGNISHLHRNDNNSEVTLNIKRIRVQVWEQTGGWMPDKLLVWGETDANGDFDLSYERTKLNLDGNIRVYLRIVNINDYVTVSRFEISGSIVPVAARLGSMTHNYTDGNEVTFNLGNINMQSGELAQVFHWTARAMEYVNVEMNGESGFEMKHIRIFIDNGWSRYNLAGSRVWLNPMHISAETVVQHETGHHIHFRILQNGKRQTHSGGTHTFAHNNSHPNQTITEGFANAVAYITDARYYLDDDEANDVRPLISWLDNNHRRFESLNNTTHPFTAEEPFARTLLDLFDDVSKFQGFGIPTNTGDWANLINDVVGGVRNDYANFSYKEIMMPFYQNRSSDANTIQDLGQYFKQLVVNTSDCEIRRHIKEVMDWNLVNTNNPTAFPERFSTDLIFVTQTINHRNDNLSQDDDFNLVEGTPTFYNYTYHAIDRSELNTTTGSFNITNNHNGWGTNLSDPLIITDGQNLFINNNINSNWTNGSNSNPAQHSHVNMSFCNQLTTVEETGRIIIGDWTEYSTATAYIGSGTTIVLESGSELIINNNSKLVIEAGGRIDFHPGAKIVLNGDNAVLEIKGDIRLMPNADFAVEGGAQGFGYLKIHRNENHAWKKPIYGMGNNKILLEGSSTSHKLIEVTGNEGWFVPNSISTVQISNCQIELGSTSRLNMEMANTLVMEDVQVLPIHSTQSPRHKGIQIWGWGAASALTRVKITHGENGLLYYPLWQHEQQSDIHVRNHVRTHTVEDCDFENNQTGIKAIRVPVWVKDSRFSGYETSGILTYGTVSSRVYIVNNLFHHSAAPSTSTGILFQGTSGINNVNIRKNEITDNRVAIHGFAATVFAGCNQIYGNASAFHLEEHADLYASTQRLSGYNTLSSNPNAIMSRYNGMVWLNEGYNILSSNPNHLQKDLSFFLNGKIGTTLPTPNLSSSYNFINPTPEYMLADGQYAQADWTDGNTHAPFNTFLYNRYTPNMNQYYTFDFGAPPISVTYTYLTEEIQTECAQSKWEDFSLPPVSNPADYADEIYSHDNLASGFLVFNTPNFPNLELNDIRASLFEAGYSLTQYSPTAIIHLYKEVLVDNYISNTAVNVGYNELLKQLLEQVAYWSENMHINNRVSDSLQEGSEYTMLHNLLEDILTQSTLDSNHFMHGDSFGLRTMQAELKRVAGNYQSALAAIENIRSTALSPFENFVLDKLECQNHAEQDLREGVVSPDSVFSLYPCLDGYFVEVPSENENRVLNTDIITSSQSALWVYPNPASKELFVQTATEAGTYFIYNITGSLVVAGRLNDKRIDISELSEGMYFIRLNTAAQTCHAKFVVAKE
ncbi:MAG: T9SS type A sorting domain-containing protein [Bacteroidia bacterium]|nr:T9SS type A sorting domain-containing protein [Bacteroidia bacterium]